MKRWSMSKIARINLDQANTSWGLSILNQVRCFALDLSFQKTGQGSPMVKLSSSHSRTVCPVNDRRIPSQYFIQQYKCYSSSSSPSSLYTDEDIPVPWGVVAARRWGDPSKKPILTVHGWKDNLASFDRLIPLILPQLEDKYFFLAIDLPGHGFSSHFPPGMIYQVIDCLMLFKRIIRHYNWAGPISYLGHSFGAILGFIYSATNPGKIENYVGLEGLTPIHFHADEIMSVIPKAISDMLKFEEKIARRSAPTYSYEEAVERLMHRSVGGLDEYSSKVLLTRGMKEVEKGSGMFRYCHDIRVQYLPVMTLSSRQIGHLAKSFKSNILHVRANDGVHYERPFVRKNIKTWIQSNSLDDESRIISFEHVDGPHHAHLASPEIVAPHVIHFFQSTK